MKTTEQLTKSKDILEKQQNELQNEKHLRESLVRLRLAKIHRASRVNANSFHSQEEDDEYPLE